jgi:hypothetical protein
MTNDILRLRDALTRDSEDSRVREKLTRDLGTIRNSLRDTGEYRVPTPNGTVLIRSEKRNA